MVKLALQEAVRRGGLGGRVELVDCDGSYKKDGNYSGCLVRLANIVNDNESRYRIEQQRGSGYFIPLLL